MSREGHTTSDSRLPVVRSGGFADLSEIEGVFREQLNREPNRGLIEDALGSAPSAICEMDGVVVGFAYCNYWGPDVVELLNIVVADEHRGKELGSKLLEYVERHMAPNVRAIILNNSDGYSGVEGGKKPATSFYERNGYRVIASTGATRVFWKDIQN